MGAGDAKNTFEECCFETISKQRTQCGVRICVSKGVDRRKLSQLVRVTLADFVAPTSQDSSKADRRHDRPWTAVTFLCAIVAKKTPAVPVSSLLGTCAEVW